LYKIRTIVRGTLRKFNATLDVVPPAVESPASVTQDPSPQRDSVFALGSFAAKEKEVGRAIDRSNVPLKMLYSSIQALDVVHAHAAVAEGHVALFPTRRRRIEEVKKSADAKRGKSKDIRNFILRSGAESG
jgi:hypothetical protein